MLKGDIQNIRSLGVPNSTHECGYSGCPLFAMSTKDLLQGKWLGHPLHPALVHVPTGLWPAALVFDLINYFGPASNSLARTASGCIAMGLLAALAAIPAGLADWWDIKPGKPARKLGWWHMGLNAAVLL